MKDEGRCECLFFFPCPNYFRLCDGKIENTYANKRYRISTAVPDLGKIVNLYIAGGDELNINFLFPANLQTKRRLLYYIKHYDPVTKY